MRFAAALTVALASASSAVGQQLLVDQGVRVSELWCFPTASDPDAWLHLPSRAVLSRDEQGRGQLSFLRYVQNAAASEPSSASISSAGGGALLHFLVNYETPQEQVRAAEQELRRLRKRPEIRLTGPVVFRDGRFALVSSVLGTGHSTETRVLGAGTAPVLEGNRIAFSFDLDPARATLLQRSFEMQTSDVSVVFDLTFAGLTDAFDAELVVDWEKVQRSEHMKRGTSLLFVASDVEKSVEGLHRENAIRLITRGGDAPSQALIDAVYARLIELLYAPVEPAEVEREQPELLDRIAEVGTRAFGLGARSAYRVQATRDSGSTVLHFDAASEVERHHFIALNLANLQDQHGVDPTAFKTVNLADPAFRQRQVQIAVDGPLRAELSRSINNVVLALRKRRAGGGETSAEVFVDANRAASATALAPFVYPWEESGDAASWLHYEFRTSWSFEGGGTHSTPWSGSDTGVITLSPPFRRSAVTLLGTAEDLGAAGVKTVVVRLEHAFFGERRIERIVLRPTDWPQQTEVDLLLPVGAPAYDYTIEWFFRDGSRKAKSGSERPGVLFVDDLPQT